MTDKDFLRREKTLSRDEARIAIAHGGMMTLEEYGHACQRLEECDLQLEYLHAELAETEKIFRDVKKRREKILTRILVAESNRDCWRRKIDSQL